MLRIHFTSQDLRRTRIAAEPDPAWELLLSLHMAQGNDGQLVYDRWRRSARGALRHAESRLLYELAPPVGYSPDFLTPTAPSLETGHDIDEALEGVRSTPPVKVQRQLEYLMIRQNPSPRLRRLARADAASMGLLTGQMRSYYDAALRPYWPSIRDQVGADRARRVRVLAGAGIDALLSTLHSGVRWNPPVLEILDFVDTDLHLDGRGLILQPSFFCWHAPTKLRDAELTPMLVYPTQPAPGALQREGPGRKAGTVALLGRTRALALEATVSGCSTTELAQACGVSPAAASQQAKVLRDARLITTRRDSGGVRHEVTALGLNLLNGPDLPV